MNRHFPFLIAAITLVSFSYFGCTTDQQPSTAFGDPPAWAKDVVWYQIMVERFYNGDPNNDPTIADIEGGYPGFAPASWQITPWTQDWYKADPYFDDVRGKIDMAGDELVHFGQISRLRRYGGDLQGVLDKLDYIDSLGVTAIYFNPLNDGASYHKYDARHWRHIDRNFGPTPQEDVAMMAAETPHDPATWQWTGADKLFLEVIDQLHARDIRVIMDFSWNHTGSLFWAFEDVAERGEASPYKDWYQIESYDDPATPENEFQYQGWMGVRDLAELKETVHHEPGGILKAYESNIYSSAAKEHIFNVTRRWLDPNGDGDPSDGVDGFRLDVAAEIGLEFWRELRREVRALNPDAYLIGEVWWEEWPGKMMDPAPYLQGDVFDAGMNYRWYKAARFFFAGAPEQISASAFVDSLTRFAGTLRPQNNAAMMNLASSHDSPHVLTSLFNRTYQYQYYNNPSATNDYRVHKPDAATYETLRMLLAFQFTFEGAPHIWMGSEMGMWSANFTRKPLIWPEFEFEDEVAYPFPFEKPTDAVKFDEELYRYYQSLVQIRNQYPSLRSGALSFVDVADEQVLVMRRQLEGETVFAVFNIGEEPRQVSIDSERLESMHDVLEIATIETGDEGMLVSLPGRSAAILSE